MTRRRTIATAIAAILLLVVFVCGSLISSRLAVEVANLKQDRQNRIDNEALLLLAWSFDDNARLIVDDQHRIILVTRGFIERTGWKREQLLNQDVEDTLIPATYREQHRHDFDAAIDEVRTKNGTNDLPINRYRIRSARHCQVMRPDGTTMDADIQLIVTPYKDSAVTVAVFSFAADIVGGDS